MFNRPIQPGRSCGPARAALCYDGGRLNPQNRDPRVYFAAERTFLAWVRTGLAMMGFGFVVARFGLFMREIGAISAGTPLAPAGPSLWVGTGLVLLGVVVNAGSAMQYVRTVRRLNAGHDVTGKPSAGGIALALVLAAAGLAMCAFLLMET